ncbi:MAG TPA: ABC transporter substrate-binding protein [Devosiaceae bacterium]
MTMRTMIWTAATAFMLGSLSAPAFAQDLTKVTARLAFIAGGIDAPFFVALGKGYFKDEGLDVTVLDGDGSTGTIQAVGNGSVQFGNASLGALVQASAQAQFKNIQAVFGLVQKDPTAVISLKDKGIQKPSDIEGKTFATEAGNLQDGMINAFAEVNGVDMNKVQIIITDNYKQALLKGDADFINAWANPDGDQINDNAPIDPPMLFADWGVNLLGSSIIVRTDWLADHEDAVRGYLRALTKAHDDVLANPDEALNYFMQYRPDANKDQIKREIQVMEKYRHTTLTEGKPFGLIDKADVQQTIDLLEKYAKVPAGWATPDSVYTDKYQPAAQ